MNQTNTYIAICKYKLAQLETSNQMFSLLVEEFFFFFCTQTCVFKSIIISDLSPTHIEIQQLIRYVFANSG